MTNVYLKPNVQVDPLFNQWYAWNLLVPPVTAAINTLERHLKAMTSFVNAPAMHAAALKNPAMRGGAFIDLDSRRAPEVRQLIETTQARCGHLVDFAKAMTQLNRMLQEKAKGQAMESLYPLVPDLLKGYVELVYDMGHNPSFRVIEALLYRSPFYAEASQTIALSLIDRDRNRPFMLSTPRLPDDNTSALDVRFRDTRLDDLFRMKRVPQPFEAIADRFAGTVDDVAGLRGLFTEQTPKPAPRYDGDGVRIRYFGHATVLIESRDVSILTDPILSYAYGAEPDRFTYEDLPDEIDYVLLTHSHHDHIHFETLLQLRHMVRHIVVPRNLEGLPQDPSMLLALANTGFTNLIEVRDLDEIPIPGGRIVALPFLGEHHDLLMESRSGYRVDVLGKSALCIADSCNLDSALSQRVKDLHGPADVLFTGMECEGAPASWIYGPMFTKPLARDVDQSRRARGSNAAEGLSLVDIFGVKQAYVYAMGQEPWLSHILDNELGDDSLSMAESRTLVDTCRKKGLVSEHLFGKKEVLL